MCLCRIFKTFYVLNAKTILLVSQFISHGASITTKRSLFYPPPPLFFVLFFFHFYIGKLRFVHRRNNPYISLMSRCSYVVDYYILFAVHFLTPELRKGTMDL